MNYKNLLLKYVPAIFVAVLTVAFCHDNWELLTQSGMRSAFIAISAVTLISIWLMVWGNKLSLNANLGILILIFVLNAVKAAIMPDGLESKLLPAIWWHGWIYEFNMYPATGGYKWLWWFVHDIAAVILIGVCAIARDLVENEKE